MSTGLVPEIVIPEFAINIALKAVIASLYDVVSEEAETIANEWAEAADVEAPNIFMKERCREVLTQELSAYFEVVVPKFAQLTAEHAEAFKTPLLPPPSAKDPEPLG